MYSMKYPHSTKFYWDVSHWPILPGQTVSLDTSDVLHLNCTLRFQGKPIISNLPEIFIHLLATLVNCLFTWFPQFNLFEGCQKILLLGRVLDVVRYQLSSSMVNQLACIVISSQYWGWSLIQYDLITYTTPCAFWLLVIYSCLQFTRWLLNYLRLLGPLIRHLCSDFITLGPVVRPLWRTGELWFLIWNQSIDQPCSKFAVLNWDSPHYWDFDLPLWIHSHSCLL